MHPHHSNLFTTFDKYVRTRHRCFIAELDFSSTQWVMCIRPTAENIRAFTQDVYTCKYISLSSEEAEEVSKANALGPKLMERIDRELSSLGEPRT